MTRYDWPHFGRPIDYGQMRGLFWSPSTRAQQEQVTTQLSKNTAERQSECMEAKVNEIRCSRREGQSTDHRMESDRSFGVPDDTKRHLML